jgi:DNA-binding transcriptional regulator YdaS (Cro superfamily)
MASLLGVSAPTVNQWVKGGRPVPIDRCPAIEHLTGGAVTRRDLRPSDWHRIWPELVSTDYPAPKEVDRETA